MVIVRVFSRSRVTFLDDLAPESAVDRLRGRGVPVLALVSDLSAPNGAGYVGLDNWKVGRTAAWAVADLRQRPGDVAIVVGSHRYRCQEACEMGARSYFREYAPDLQLLEPRCGLSRATGPGRRPRCCCRSTSARPRTSDRPSARLLRHGQPVPLQRRALAGGQLVDVEVAD